MKFLKAVSVVLMMFVVGNVSAQKKKTEKFEKLEIEMFPKAKEGFKQVYIQLPVAKNENDLKVEFFVGVEKLLDCNKHFLMEKLLRKIYKVGVTITMK